MNTDFSDPIKQLARIEVQRLTEQGEDPETALEQVNGALAREVLRFPVQLAYGENEPV